jgi:hypothetical protein
MLSLTFSWDGVVIFNKSVSAENPPPICFGIPHIPIVDACVEFSNMNITKHHISGCISLVLEVLTLKVADIKLGCFTLPTLAIEGPATGDIAREMDRGRLTFSGLTEAAVKAAIQLRAVVRSQVIEARKEKDDTAPQVQVIPAN